MYIVILVPIYYNHIRKKAKEEPQMKKANVYEMVTDRIISELEKGVIPWQKPWTGIRSGAFNRITKRPYIDYFPYP